ncbi:MAG: DUF4358 domain-containing protein [Clostridia bacterium]|nr:DUF4358 domain-containing protein [Clostridia bacterium]
MNNTKRMIALALSVLCLTTAATMTACSGGSDSGKDTTAGESTSTATLDSIYEAVSATLPNADTLTDAQDSYLSGFFGGATADDFASYKIVMQSMSTSIDNVGIFEAKTADDVKNIEAMIDGFLDFYENTVWDDTYLETEFPKLQNAERVTGGNFVMYVIADDDTRAAAISAFENAVK